MDEDLDKVRVYLRLAVRWDWLSAGQYQHVAQMVTEIGKLLGGWIKSPAPKGCQAISGHQVVFAGVCPNRCPPVAGRRFQQ